MELLPGDAGEFSAGLFVCGVRPVHFSTDSWESRSSEQLGDARPVDKEAAFVKCRKWDLSISGKDVCMGVNPAIRLNNYQVKQLFPAKFRI